MIKYTAVFGKHNGRIISVGAANEDEARERIREQLGRPGRKDALVRWEADGAKIIET